MFHWMSSGRRCTNEHVVGASDPVHEEGHEMQDKIRR